MRGLERPRELVVLVGKVGQQDVLVLAQLGRRVGDFELEPSKIIVFVRVGAGRVAATAADVGGGGGSGSGICVLLFRSRRGALL